MARGRKRQREEASPDPADGDPASAPATAGAPTAAPEAEGAPPSAPPSPSAPPPPSPPSAPSPTPSKKKLKPLPATPSFKAAHQERLRNKARRIQLQLTRLYPNPPIPLQHGSAFQLLVAVMLSAQSTDVKVNSVTPALFARGPDAATMAAMQVSEIEGIIRVLGLAPTKAKNLLRMSQLLVEQHAGQVPDSFEALEALPGVGHKTASVVMSQAFGRAAFPVDTHIHRLAQRWGLSNGKSVEQTEQDLKTLLPEETWRDVHLQMIFFGREHCPAQRHDAATCPICRWAAPGARSSAPDLEADDAAGEPRRLDDALAEGDTAPEGAGTPGLAPAVTSGAPQAQDPEPTAGPEPLVPVEPHTGPGSDPTAEVEAVVTGSEGPRTRQSARLQKSAEGGAKSGLFDAFRAGPAAGKRVRR